MKKNIYQLLSFNDNDSMFEHEEPLTYTEAAVRMAKEFISAYDYCNPDTDIRPEEISSKVQEILSKEDESEAGFDEEAGIAWLRNVRGINYDWQIVELKMEKPDPWRMIAEAEAVYRVAQKLEISEEKAQVKYKDVCDEVADRYNNYFVNCGTIFEECDKIAGEVLSEMDIDYPEEEDSDE